MIDRDGLITAVYVSDQEKALNFYVKTLGLKKVANHSYGSGLRWIEVAREGYEQYALALLQPGQLGEGHSGLAFVADDVQTTYEKLRDRVEWDWEPVEREWGTDAQFVVDDKGYLIVDPLYHKRPH